MTRRPMVRITPVQESEIVALYADRKISTPEILSTYGINSRQMYRVLKRQGATPNRYVGRRSSNERTRAMVDAANGTNRASAPATLAVTVNNDGLVVSASRDAASEAAWPSWTITYEGVVRVRARAIEEAISRARSNPEVRCIVGAQQVQA